MSSDKSKLHWTVPSTKQLHTQQCKDHNEEKEQEQQADNGLHGTHQGYN